MPTKTRRLRTISRLCGVGNGERAVIIPGLCVGGLVLGVVGVSTWWTVRSAREAAEDARRTQVQAVSRVLSQSAETMLAGSEWTALRRMVADAARELELGRCRIVLSDGTVLADADPSRISVVTPEAWPPPGAMVVTPHVPGRVEVRTPLLVPGHGQAMLEVGAAVTYPGWTAWEAQAGIGVGAFAGVLLTYRVMRRRWLALGAIGDALRWNAGGERDAASLEVSPALGGEAASWNALVREREALRVRTLLTASAEPGGTARAAEGAMTAALDALWHGVLVLDERGVVVAANGAAGVVLQAAREAIVGAPAARLLGAGGGSDIVSGVLAEGSRSRASVEVERTGSGGERTMLRLTARRLRREDGAAAVVVIEDVTQQRVADESRNAFVAQATHELRTPLTNIRLYAETLVDDGENDPALRAKCLNVITGESRRLERIIADMLSVSEMEAGVLKLRTDDVRLDALFEELEADFRAQAEDREIALRVELPPKLPVIQGDRDKLVLALHNLVGNALKYTPAGGAVRVKADAEGGVLRVSVTDNGIGIKPEEQELVFERFYRAKDKRITGITGSGLGLALARQVVRMHGGDITVESQVDKGSTFTLSVPLAPSPAVCQAA
ncbi:MAG: ATP-binding protein [Planctomycetota bacterium]|nr:ATP-binding protein [Planctomycetota bacterium]